MFVDSMNKYMNDVKDLWLLLVTYLQKSIKEYDMIKS